MTTNYHRFELSPLQNQIEDLKTTTRDTIDKVLERGENIDKLVENTSQLQLDSKKFLQTTKKLKRKMYCKRVKFFLVGGCISIISIYIVASAICGHFDLSKC